MIGVCVRILLNLESWKVETLFSFCEMPNEPFEISLNSLGPLNNRQRHGDGEKRCQIVIMTGLGCAVLC